MLIGGSGKACLQGIVLLVGMFLGGVAIAAQSPTPSIDMLKARELLQKSRAGNVLTPEEQQYLEQAQALRRAQGAKSAERTAATSPRRTSAASRPALTPRESTGMVPLSDMTATDRYKNEDGGLYGAGQNTPPAKHQEAARAQLARIRPLNAQGQPADEGKIVFISISMSNATQEFTAFKQIADADPRKSPRVTIVDCAQGGQAMAEWVNRAAPAWTQAQRRLSAAGVSAEQVQVAWVKLANKMPQGDLQEHGKKLEQDTQAVLQNARARFPNLRIAYLSSRIYGGYAPGQLNPEPYAYEGAFAVRWLIQRQIQGDAALNFDSARGEVKMPLLLWGPYLWADGVTPRKSDGLTWSRTDLARDGTHPSPDGRQKVAKMILEFCATNPLAAPWFTK